ncbi:MAG: CDP-alcohol phosphatidyltransferase family protein [Halanaerobiales bacterium]|nr:CDP-alcohol phosphatidyltransferase family protein [Halanaerobiales bacterium]
MVKMMRNIPNMLTLSRVVLTVLLNFYIFNYFGSMSIPILIFVAIFLTDFLDGKIARLNGKTSSFGAVFDVLADLFYMVVSYIVLYRLQIIPLWFLFVILIKFLEFVITSYFLKNYFCEKSIFVFDYIGRLVAVLFYIIPVLAYVSSQFSQSIYFFIIQLIYIITFMAFTSFIYRLWSCVKVCKFRLCLSLLKLHYQ